MAGRTAIEQARREGYCPACGYQTFDEGSTGTWSICPICGWEDEPYPLDEPETATGGPSGNLSIRGAQENVKRYGDVHEGGCEQSRAPRPDETRHPDWPFPDKS